MSKPTLENLIIQGSVDYLVVKVENRYEDSLRIRGENGELNLALDGEYESDRKITTGTVVAIPRKLSDEKVLFFENGKPVKLNKIQPDVNQFEQVCFSYLSLDDSMEVAPSHYAIPYGDIICVIRDGKPVTIGSHVLYKEAYPDGVIDVGDGVMGRENSFGMVTEINVPPIPFQGIVAYTGLPLKDEENLVQPGQRVGIDKFQYGTRIKVLNEWYYYCREKDLSWVFAD